MHKNLMLIVTLVLGLSITCWADIDQAQVMEIGSVNSLLLSGSGLIVGDSMNVVTGNALQQATSANGRVFTAQYEDATLMQSIIGAGVGGSYGVDQTGLGIASQLQTQDGTDQADQNQSLSAALDTQSAAVGGDAVLGTMQAFIGNQVQLALTPYSASVNISRTNVIDSGYIRRNAATTLASSGIQ